MTTFLDGKVTQECGDALDVLSGIESDRFNSVITSPPYYGLRDYKMPGQVGVETTPDAYVKRIVDVMRQVRRVLRPDGTLWLNLGDSYANDAKWGGNTSGKHGNNVGQVGRARRTTGLKPKDLIGIPWMVAFALRADGWWLRQDNIWSKRNPMPESVEDRTTRSHEYVFMLTKAERYYYDHEAIKEPAISGDPRKPYAPGVVDARGNGHARGGGKVRPSVKRGGFAGKTAGQTGREAFRAVQDWRNKRSVWEISSLPFAEAHFATFPPELITPCILAGCPVGGEVLDPFGGAGTTALVAVTHQRRAMLVELNPDYCTMAQARIESAFMGRDEGAAHMARALGKVEAPGPLFA